jgi:hypothetical protein
LFTGPRRGKVLNGGFPDESFLRKAEGHKQIMDFYLVQTAAAHGVRLATRDRGTLTAWPQHTIGVSSKGKKASLTDGMGDLIGSVESGQRKKSLAGYGRD